MWSKNRWAARVAASPSHGGHDAARQSPGVCSPSPDDVELFLGGTLLLKHVADGSAVRVVLMSWRRGGARSCAFSEKPSQEALKHTEERGIEGTLPPHALSGLLGLDLPDRGMRELLPATVNRALACRLPN